MPTVRDHRSSEQYRLATAKLLVGLAPALDEPAALALLQRARAWHMQALFDLHDHLVAHPDALRSGDSAIPASLLRLIWMLVDAGHGDVTVPTCVSCGRPSRQLPGMRDDGRICAACYQRDRKTNCCRCGRSTKAAYRRAEGIICSSCRDLEPASRGVCPGCGYHKPLSRGCDGTLRCARCRPVTQRSCVDCGKRGRVSALTEDGPVCGWCRDIRSARRCGGCGRIRPIAQRATATTPDLCLRCRPRTVGICTRCGRHTTGNRTERGRGEFLCQPCQPKINHSCAICRGDAAAAAFWPVGPVCLSCYKRARRNPEPCARCGNERVLTGIDQHGRVCGVCAGGELHYLCQRCGSGRVRHDEHLCDRCALDDTIDQLLGARRDDPQLLPLARALRTTDHPISSIKWIRYKRSGRLLAQLLADGEPLTHELLDRQPPTQHLHVLRHRLVRVGVLPDRGEYLERVGPWLEQLLADQPAARRDLVRRYARWCVLHRARKRATHRPITVSAGYHLRYQLSTVLDLLTWLDQRECSITTVGQADIDRWIIHNARSIHNGIRRFLAWARDRHGTPPLTVPRPPDTNASPRPMDEHTITAQLRRCLHDESLPVDVRVAGATIMLFGVSMARLVQLTIDEVTSRDGAVWLNAGRAPIRMPSPLDRLLTRLATAPADPSPISRAVGPPRYLFPGTAAGRPMHPSSLNRRLRRYEITAEPARHTALLHLAADLPAAILADLLGVHVNTILRWAEHSGGDWTPYLVARAGA